MHSTLWARLAAATGLLFPVLLLVGDDVIAGGDRVAPDAGTPDQVLANLAEANAPSYFIGRSIGSLPMICLLVFAVYVACQLRAHRGPGSILPYIAVGAGTLAAAGGLSTGAIQMTLVQREGAGLNPELAVTLLETTFGFETVALPIGLLLAAVAVEGVRGTFIAKWLGWAAAVLAVAFLPAFFLGNMGGVDEGLVQLAFLPMILSWVWFVAASVSLIRRAGKSPTGRSSGKLTQAESIG